MISPKQAREVMVTEAQRRRAAIEHADWCIRDAALVGNAECEITFSHEGEYMDGYLRELGYAVEVVEPPNRLRVKW